MVAKKAKDGGVYFATAKTIGLTKIGCSNSLEVRIESLRAFCPDDDIDVFVIANSDCRSLESTFHNVFKHLRQHGEWFALAEPDIARVKAKYGELVKELGGVRTHGTSKHFKRLAATYKAAIFTGDKWTVRREIALAHWGQVSESIVGELSLYGDGEPTKPETAAAVHAWIDCYGYGNLPKGYFAFISDCQKRGLTFYQAMNQKFPDDYDSGTERIPDWGYVTVDELLYEARKMEPFALTGA